MLQVPIKDVNELLTCTLCQGYLREAHAIPDCMHRFCKTCILKHFSENNLRGSISCPICKINLGTYTLNKIIYDRNVQAVVDELFPHFATEEKLAEEAFYADRGIKRKHDATESQRESQEVIIPAKEDEEVTFKLLQAKTLNPGRSALPTLRKPTFKSDRNIKVAKVQKFVFKRVEEFMSVEEYKKMSPDDIEILNGEEVMRPDSDLTALDGPGEAIGGQKAYVLFYRLK